MGFPQKDCSFLQFKRSQRKAKYHSIGANFVSLKKIYAKFFYSNWTQKFEFNFLKIELKFSWIKFKFLIFKGYKLAKESIEILFRMGLGFRV